MENTSSIEWWLADLRSHFTETNPALTTLYDTYAAEAVFGRHFIDSDLGNIQPGSHILEVGAGALLLSCQLVREGFQVTALEPVGAGFSHFAEMRQIVQDRATSLNCLPATCDITAEEFAERNIYDYAFSINVMEHVDDVATAITNIVTGLKPGAIYHFTAPNYYFPYEPHFNIPTLFSKRLTEAILREKIYECKKMAHPLETWRSLNWINTSKIQKIGRQLPSITTTFNRLLLVSTIERIASDSIFASRRSPFMRKILFFLLKYRIHKLLQFIPVALQPIIDCRLQKKSAASNAREEIWRK